MSLTNRNQPDPRASHPGYDESEPPPPVRPRQPSRPGGFPPPYVEGPPVHAAPPAPPPDPWVKIKHWAWILGVLWALLTAASGGAAWVFGAGQKSAEYPTKDYVDKQVLGEKAVSELHAAQLVELQKHVGIIEVKQDGQGKTLDEIKRDVHEMANRPRYNR